MNLLQKLVGATIWLIGVIVFSLLLVLLLLVDGIGEGAKALARLIANPADRIFTALTRDLFPECNEAQTDPIPWADRGELNR